LIFDFALKEHSMPEGIRRRSPRFGNSTRRADHCPNGQAQNGNLPAGPNYPPTARFLDTIMWLELKVLA
jgi:hypothetical protein